MPGHPEVIFYVGTEGSLREKVISEQNIGGGGRGRMGPTRVRKEHWAGGKNSQCKGPEAQWRVQERVP